MTTQDSVRDVPVGSLWYEDSTKHGFVAIWEVTDGSRIRGTWGSDRPTVEIKLIWYHEFACPASHPTQVGEAMLHPTMHLEGHRDWHPIDEEDIPFYMMRNL